VQDGGRIGLTHVGVPVSGAFHRRRYLVATALLAGAPDPTRPAIEVLAGELRLELAVESVLAVVGPGTMHIDDRQTAVGTAVLAHAGGHVALVPDGSGPIYLVISGWAPPRVLGSAATDTFSRLGGGLLTAGSALVGTAEPQARGRVGAFHRPLGADTGPLRALPSTHSAMAGLASASWTVTSVARSGVRLTGPVLPAHGSAASMPVVAGAIQATPGGSAIILGPDGGLTGGYPVVAVVASADLDRISLVAPGDSLTFRTTDVEAAAQAWVQREREVERCIAHPDLLP
jgi:allophanate hydrolase subunit 2